LYNHDTSPAVLWVHFVSSGLKALPADSISKDYLDEAIKVHFVHRDAQEIVICAKPNQLLQRWNGAVQHGIPELS
jgi:hypothetical protein